MARTLLTARAWPPEQPPPRIFTRARSSFRPGTYLHPTLPSTIEIAGDHDCNDQGTWSSLGRRERRRRRPERPRKDEDDQKRRRRVEGPGMTPSNARARTAGTNRSGRLVAFASIPQTLQLASSNPQSRRLASSIPQSHQLASLNPQNPQTLRLASSIPQSHRLASSIPQSLQLASSIPQSDQLASQVECTRDEEDEERMAAPVGA